MKNGKLIFFILVVLFVGLLGWWRWRWNISMLGSISAAQTPMNGTGSGTSQSLVSNAPKTPGARSTPGANSNNGNPVSSSSTNPTSSTGMTKEQLFQDALNATNLMPINYYGKVVDQNGNPIVGAGIVGNVMLNVGFDSSRNEPYSTETDAQGMFQFTGLHGVNIGISITKDGYEIDGHGRGFKRPAGGKQSTASDPAVFTMYRLQGAEPMMHSKLDSRVPYDGTPATFDLVTGKKSDAGDFKITLIRNPLQIIRRTDHYEWEVQIEVIGGGLVESHDAYPYEAPDGGYQAVFDFSQAQNATGWTRELATTFYVHTSGDLYGRVTIDLFSDAVRPDTGISIETWMNPAPGSRDLEFDPKNVVKGQ